MVTSRRGAGTNGFMNAGTLGTPNSSRKTAPPSSRYGESRKPSPIRMTALVSMVWCVMTARQVLPQLATSSGGRSYGMWTTVVLKWQLHTSYIIHLHECSGHDLWRGIHSVSQWPHAACCMLAKVPAGGCNVCMTQQCSSSIKGCEAHSPRRPGRSSRLQMGSAVPPTPRCPAPTGSPGSARLL